MRSQLLLAAVSCALASGCLGDLFNLQSEESDDPTIEVPKTQFPQCTGALEQVDDDLYIAADFPEPSPGETRYDETPVSPKGCIRWFRQVVNGQLVSQGLIAARGDVEWFVLDGGVGFKEQSRYLVKEDFTPTSQRLEIDSDGDGYLESVMASRYDAEGLVEQVISFFGMSNGAIVERRTLKRVDAQTLRWIEEKLISGELKTVRDQVAPAKMEAGINGSLGCYKDVTRNRDCSKQQQEQIQKELEAALKKGKACLDRGTKGGLKSNARDRKILEHLMKTRAKKVVRGCYEGADDYAYVHLFGSSPYGEKLMMVNVGLLSCEPSSFVQSTLFHEMLHITRGPHSENDDDLFRLRKEGKISHEQFVLTDSRRACQEYCFEEVRNQCTCAACFETLACDDACKDEPSCDIRGTDGGYAITVAVGALCKMPEGMESGTHWNNSIKACESSCAFGKCTSYGVSCNPNCN
jgi:hypothetical protein